MESKASPAIGMIAMDSYASQKAEVIEGGTQKVLSKVLEASEAEKIKALLRDKIMEVFRDLEPEEVVSKLDADFSSFVDEYAEKQLQKMTSTQLVDLLETVLQS